jgi:hypothetical protein
VASPFLVTYNSDIMADELSTAIAASLDDLPGAMRAQVIEELCNGINKDWVNAGIQQRKIAYQTNEIDRKSIDGIGRMRMRIDPTLYHYWGTKLGYDCWKDNQFLNEVERDNPEVRVKSGGTRLQVGWSGSKRSSQKFAL